MNLYEILSPLMDDPTSTWISFSCCLHLNCPVEWKHLQFWTFLAVTTRYLMKKMHIFHKFKTGISCLSLNLLLLFYFLGKDTTNLEIDFHSFFSLLLVIIHHHRGQNKRFCTTFCDMNCVQIDIAQKRPRCSSFFVCIRFVLFGWFLREENGKAAITLTEIIDFVKFSTMTWSFSLVFLICLEHNIVHK